MPLRARTKVALASFFGGIPFAVVVAMAFAWAANAGQDPSADESDLMLLSLLALQMAIYFVFAFVKPLEKLFESRLVIPLACLAGLIGVAIRHVGSSFGLGAGAPVVVQDVLIVVFQSATMLWAMRIIARLSMKRAMVSIVLWQVLLSIILFAVMNCGWSLVGDVLLVVSPVCVLACSLLHRHGESPLAQGTESEDRPERNEGSPEAGSHGVGAGVPVRLMVMVALIVLTIYTLQLSVSSGQLTLSHIGSFMMPLLVTIVFVSNPQVMRLRFVYNASIALLAVSSFLVVAGGACYNLAAILADASYSTFAVFYFTVLCGLSQRYGTRSTMLFGVAFGIECAAGLMGAVLAGAAAGAGIAPSVVVCGTMTLALVAFVCLPTDNDYLTLWGTRRALSSGEDVANYYYALPDTCAAVTRQYGLSRREEEVLLLLAQKKTAAASAQELCVSETTVKTHTRNIYRKLGIHAKAELLELMGYPGADARPGDE